MRGCNNIERGLAQGRNKIVCAHLPQFDVEAELACTRLGVVEAGHVHADELEPVAKRQERRPEVERLRPGTADVEDAKTLRR